jgi:uncharacterized damage-inducible protein DinB
MNAATALYMETIERSDAVLRRAVEDLSADELRNQPAGPRSNPVGWLVWHMTRTRDSIIASITGAATIWESDGWADRFGMAGEPPRFVPENVHTFDPKDFETLIGYFDAVAEKTKEAVEGMPEDDMERLVESTIPGRPAQPVASRLSVIMNDNIQHAGQIAYLRGLIRGHGWL